MGLDRPIDKTARRANQPTRLPPIRVIEEAPEAYTAGRAAWHELTREFSAPWRRHCDAPQYESNFRLNFARRLNSLLDEDKGDWGRFRLIELEY